MTDKKFSIHELLALCPNVPVQKVVRRAESETDFTFGSIGPPEYPPAIRVSRYDDPDLRAVSIYGLLLDLASRVQALEEQAQK